MLDIEEMKSVLYVAIAEKKVRTIEVVMPRLNLKEAIRGSDSALHIAVKHKVNKEIFQLLIGAGVPLEAENHRQMTPLDYALLLGYVEPIKILIEAGARFDRRGTKEKTYLEFFEAEHPREFQDVIEVINRRIRREEVPKEHQNFGFMFNLRKSLGFNHASYGRIQNGDPLKAQSQLPNKKNI